MAAIDIQSQGLNPCPARAAEHISSQRLTLFLLYMAANYIPFKGLTIVLLGAPTIPALKANPWPARAANHIPRLKGLTLVLLGPLTISRLKGLNLVLQGG